MTTDLSKILFPWPSNVQCHDLLPQSLSIPVAIKRTLGLGLKCCLSQKPYNSNTFNIERLTRDVRLRSLFDKTTKNDTHYVPQLYVANKEFQPKPAHPQIEEALTQFAAAVQRSPTTNPSPTRTRIFQPTLLRHHYDGLRQLRNHPTIMAIPSDKNLGPVLIDRASYIQQALKEHLHNEANYRQISQADADRIRFKALRLTVDLADFYLNPTSPDYTYFQRAIYGPNNPHRIINNELLTRFRMSQFYCTVKMHKTPQTFRPVVSTSGATTEILSKWLDYQLQRVVHLCPGYLKDNWSLLAELKNEHSKLPANSYIATADAVSMYSNINIEHGIAIIEKWLDLHIDDLPNDFPTKMVVEGIKIVMTNNVFAFGDTFWHQLAGTAMGTSVAVMFATIYYSYYEETAILTKTARHFLQLTLYRRFIDDMVCIIQTNDPRNAHVELNRIMNNFGPNGLALEWEVEKLSRSTNFLDLTLELMPTSDNQLRLMYRTYQKPMNLHLYIPRFSAHSPSIFKSFIYGSLRRYLLQNSSPASYQDMVKKFFYRLLQRGYPLEETKTLFLNAATLLDRNPPSLPVFNQLNSPVPNRAPTDGPSTLYLHCRFHPNTPSRRTIRNLYQKTLGPVLQLRLGIAEMPRLTIAYSRQPNIMDTSVRTTLPQTDGFQLVSSLIPRAATHNHNGT